MPLIPLDGLEAERQIQLQRDLDKAKKDTHRNGRSIALIQPDLQFSPCARDTAQSHVVKQPLAPASGGAKDSCKKDAL